MRWLRLLFFAFSLICIFSLLLVRGAFLANGSDRAFEAPTRSDRIAAVGDLRYLPDEEKRAFFQSSSFQSKRPPGSSDWLASHREPGQTFDQFLRTRRNLFQAPHTVLYIQPIGTFDGEASKVLDQVATYAEIFFQAEVKLQDTVTAEPLGITTRTNPGGMQEQFLTRDILKWLGKEMPNDAYARIAVSMTDLYPEPSWNFVFGQASTQERVGVFSFYRYGDPGTQSFLRRCIQVFSHETGHMFGIYHCIHYECLMNGSNHLEESDHTPLFLCPVCLRKLHSVNAISFRERYRKLGAFFREAGLREEELWIKQRLEDFGE